MFENVMVVLFLVFLEGILSFDNALALAAMVRHLPMQQQKRALTYGIFGAFVFRFISLFFIIHVLENPFVKLAGGLYLCWLAINNLRPKSAEEISSGAFQSFWRTVVLVELTDIVFSIDSILAAAALSQILWVIVIGGVLGIVMMRFVSSIFIRLIDVYPRLEKSAFMLVGIVGIKLLIESQTFRHFNFSSSAQPEFWVFWAAMVLSLVFGFTGIKRLAAF